MLAKVRSARKLKTRAQALYIYSSSVFCILATAVIVVLTGERNEKSGRKKSERERKEEEQGGGLIEID